MLATTRLGENELHGSHRDRSFLPVDELPPEDALALIETYQPNQRLGSEPERAAARLEFSGLDEAIVRPSVQIYRSPA